MKPRHLILVFLCIVVLYPLSIGPVMLREMQMAGAPSGVPAFYKPLMQLSRVSPAFGDLLIWYLELWGMSVARQPQHQNPD